MSRLPMRLRHILGLLVVLAAGTPSDAYAADDPPKQEELPRRQANYAWEKNEKTGQTLLKANFSYRDVVDRAITDKLTSGIPQTMVMRAFVLREGEKNPLALAGRTCTIKYELWEEVYRVKIGTAAERGVINLEGVLRQCAQVSDLVVADKALLTGTKPFFLGVIVEVNPVSPQMLAQMQQWIARPAGSTGIGPGDALFGSFVGLFVRQIGTADKTLRFRTQSFVPP